MVVISCLCVATSLPSKMAYSQTEAAPSVSSQSENESYESAIRSLLQVQADAWNEGDLDAFMQTYWKTDQLTFSSGGKTTRGWQATLDNYRAAFAPPKQMGKLRFDNLEFVELAPNAALVLGQWHLKMKEDERRDGNFSLVFKKMKNGWKIIHDHSSRLRTPKVAPQPSEPENDND